MRPSPRDRRSRRIGGTEQQAHVRGIERRRLNAHDDLVGARRRHHDLDERQLELKGLAEPVTVATVDWSDG